MRRRFSYAFAAGVLSSAAPYVLRTRLARPFICAAIGYMLGRQADELADLSQTDTLTRLLNARGGIGNRSASCSWISTASS